MARTIEEHPAVGSEPASYEDYFTEFYRSNYQRALSLVRFRTTGCDCEALVAEAFLLAWQHLVANGEVSAAWLFVVLRNRIGDHYRSTRTRPTTAASESVSPVEIQDMAQRADTRLDVERALHRLPPTYSEPLVLVYWCSLTGPEAARVLGLRDGAFRMRLQRAQRAFLRAFDEPLDPEEA